MTTEEYEAEVYSQCESYFLGIAESGAYTSEEEFVEAMQGRANELAWEASRDLADRLGEEALLHSDDLFTYYSEEDLLGRSEIVLARLAVKTDCYNCFVAMCEAMATSADDLGATEITDEQEEEISRGYI